jgi:hypothetical protein
MPMFVSVPEADSVGFVPVAAFASVNAFTADAVVVKASRELLLVSIMLPLNPILTTPVTLLVSDIITLLFCIAVPDAPSQRTIALSVEEPGPLTLPVPTAVTHVSVAGLLPSVRKNCPTDPTPSGSRNVDVVVTDAGAEIAI